MRREYYDKFSHFFTEVDVVTLNQMTDVFLKIDRSYLSLSQNTPFYQELREC